MNVSCVSLNLPSSIATSSVYKTCASTSSSSLIEIYIMCDACVHVVGMCVRGSVYCHKRWANFSNGIEGMNQMIWYVKRRPLSQTTVDLTTTLNQTRGCVGTTFRIILCLHCRQTSAFHAERTSHIIVRFTINDRLKTYKSFVIWFAAFDRKRNDKV